MMDAKKISPTEDFDMHAMELTVLRREIDRLHAQLAICSNAALGYMTNVGEVVTPGDYGWSHAYEKVLDLRRDTDWLIEQIERSFHGDARTIRATVAKALYALRNARLSRKTALPETIQKSEELAIADVDTLAVENLAMANFHDITLAGELGHARRIAQAALDRNPSVTAREALTFLLKKPPEFFRVRIDELMRELYTYCGEKSLPLTGSVEHVRIVVDAVVGANPDATLENVLSVLHLYGASPREPVK